MKSLYYLHTCYIRHVTLIHICNCYVCVQLYAYVTYLLRIHMCDIYAYSHTCLSHRKPLSYHEATKHVQTASKRLKFRLSNDVKIIQNIMKINWGKLNMIYI